MTSKVQPWLLPYRYILFADVDSCICRRRKFRRLLGVRICVREFSGGFLFTAAEWGFELGPAKVRECGWWIRSRIGLPLPRPHPPHRLGRCCRNDCSHGLGCLLQSSSGINTPGWKWPSFLAADKISRCATKFLELCVGTGAGEGGWGHGSSGQGLFGWVWINWTCSSCWSRGFCYQPPRKKGWPVACTADVLELISGGEQSKTQWFVGVESQQQCNGPAPKAAVGRGIRREGRRAPAKQRLLLCASAELK